MKTNKKISLSLNKKVISNLQMGQLNGGSSGHTNFRCPTQETCVGDATCGNCTIDCSPWE